MDMKRETVPTAPAERAKREPKISVKLRVFWIFLGVISISVIVGFSGSILARSYPPHWPFASSILVSDTQTPELIFIDSGPDTVSTEIVSILKERQAKTIVSVFPNATTSYRDETELGKGIIISTDGWIVLLGQIAENQTSLTIVLPDGRVFVTEELISDTYSDIVFAKIDASQLPVVDFRTSEVQLGESLIFYSYSVANADRVSFGQIENVAFASDTTFTTEHPNLVYLTDQASRPEYLGAPVFDMSGALVGIDVLDHRIIPVSEISRNIFTIFSEKDISQRDTVIEYTPMYRVADSEAAMAQKGVKITSISKALDELEVGDIILSVNGTPLNAQNDLSRLLADLPIKSEIEMKISRDGKQSTVTVEL